MGSTSEVMGRFDLFPLTGRAEAGAVLDATVTSHETRWQLTVRRSTAGQLRVPRIDLAPGTSLRLRIRARDVMIATERPEG